MKSLKDIAKDVVATYRTDLNPIWVLDKNICTVEGHCYIDEVYESLFINKKITTKKLLEIGVHYGGSMLLWERYFPNAEIHGMDITPSEFFQNNHSSRIKLQTCDAYTDDVVNSLNNDYDIIIDDGPHTLESMRFFVKHYLAKLNVNGIAVIEDIPQSDWIRVLLEDLSPNGMKTKIQVFDMRNINMRFDDMVMVIQRRE